MASEEINLVAGDRPVRSHHIRDSYHDEIRNDTILAAIWPTA